MREMNVAERFCASSRAPDQRKFVRGLIIACPQRITSIFRSVGELSDARAIDRSKLCRSIACDRARKFGASVRFGAHRVIICENRRAVIHSFLMRRINVAERRAFIQNIVPASGKSFAKRGFGRSFRKDLRRTTRYAQILYERGRILSKIANHIFRRKNRRGENRFSA